MTDIVAALKQDLLAYIDSGVSEDDYSYTVQVSHCNILKWFDALDRLSAQQRVPVVRVPKFSVIMHQIALWSDDEGLDLSTGQGDALTRRIMAAIEIAPQSDRQPPPGQKQVGRLLRHRVPTPPDDAHSN